MSTFDTTAHTTPGDLPAPLPLLPRMTEEEFVAWCTRETRAEWVDGEVIEMSPASIEHVDLNSWFSKVLGLFVEHHNLGVVLGPEAMVRLSGQNRRRVPDLFFISNDHRERLRENHVEGAPDLAIEIVSPDSEARDWREKYLEYEEAGVREYWVVDPNSKHVEVYSLNADDKYGRISELDGAVTSTVLPDFTLKTDWLWAGSRPPVLEVLKQLGVLGE